MLTINGNYTQTLSGILVMELGGLAISQFDRLLITGSATLDGILFITKLGDFLPVSGNMFELLRFGSRSGEFLAVIGGYTANYGASNVTVAAN